MSPGLLMLCRLAINKKRMHAHPFFIEDNYLG